MGVSKMEASKENLLDMLEILSAMAVKRQTACSNQSPKGARETKKRVYRKESGISRGQGHVEDSRASTTLPARARAHPSRLGSRPGLRAFP